MQSVVGHHLAPSGRGKDAFASLARDFQSYHHLRKEDLD